MLFLALSFEIHAKSLLVLNTFCLISDANKVRTLSLKKLGYQVGGKTLGTVSKNLMLLPYNKYHI
jgi:hypothetical protein